MGDLMITIIFKCFHCQGANKHRNEGAELIQDEFTTFSDAVQHSVNNPSHWIDLQVIVEESGQ